MSFTNILCEATCFFDVCRKKTVKFCGLKENGKFKDWHTEKNKNYISPKHRPKWCIKYNKKRCPQFYCLGPIGGMKCPFLIISNCRKEEYAFMGYGLSILEKKAKKKWGKMFDYDDAMPRSKKEIKMHMKILNEFAKEKSLAKLKGVF